ncbi:MAG: type III pantothenate kinase [Acutalibacteraceae bacterium]|nr:type III pantothenate kinase [Acutalibacteraceae bacterium]
MLLTIDIGNTNITIGVYDSDKLVFVSRIATDRSKTPDQYAIDFKQIFALYNTSQNGFQGAAISSVVPELSSSISEAVEKITGCTAMILGPGIKTGMNILIDNPAQLGADLLAGCVGAAALYPLPCLVVDLGTASKISVIDKNGSFCGCTITPGIGISLDALSARTSQLPNISLKTPKKAIGKNTIDSMQSGTVFGYAAMIDGLCEKLEEELGEKVISTVATGGLAKDLIKSCKRDIIYNGELIHYGLKVLYEKNNK